MFSQATLAFTANLEVQLIGMEACSGAYFLGRALREQGHEVRLMPAQSEDREVDVPDELVPKLVMNAFTDDRLVEAFRRRGYASGRTA